MSEVDLDDIKRRMEGSLNSLKTESWDFAPGAPQPECLSL